MAGYPWTSDVEETLTPFKKYSWIWDLSFERRCPFVDLSTEGFWVLKPRSTVGTLQEEAIRSSEVFVTTHKTTLEVCIGPGLGPSLGLVAQIMFGFGPGPNDNNQTLYGTFRTFSGHYCFAKKSYSCLRSSYARDTVGLRKKEKPTDLIFVAAPSQK
jgi:hypothetical protein